MTVRWYSTSPFLSHLPFTLAFDERYTKYRETSGVHVWAYGALFEVYTGVIMKRIWVDECRNDTQPRRVASVKTNEGQKLNTKT